VAKKHQLAAIVVCSIPGLLLATASVAQTATSAIEEIVVTAQKREQSLQDVGIAVTAFSGDQIHNLGLTASTDVVAMTPGLSYTTPQADTSTINFFLRGVGLNDFADANENPVAVYVDDVYRPASGGLSFQLFDLERVEVLRGPQGTLFGRNTTGGLVHFISKKPTDTLDGYIDLGYGRFNEIKAEGALGGPLGEAWSGRLSAAMDKYDGFTENRYPGAPDYSEGNSVAVRGQLQLKAGPGTYLLSSNYSDNDAAVGAWQHQSTTLAGENGDVSVPLGPNEQSNTVDCNADGMLDDNDFRPAPGTDCFGYADTDGDPWAGDYDRHGKVETKSTGGQLHADWALGGDMTLTSITAYQTVDRLQSEDTDASPNPFIMPTFQAKTDTFTEELRLSGSTDRLRWLVGAYYFDNTVDGHYLLDLTNLGFVYFDANYTQDTESWAAFGQLEFDLSTQWRLIAGLRYANDKKDLDYLNLETTGLYQEIIGTDVAFEFNKATVGNLAKHDDDSLSGKIELDWRPSSDLLLYGSVSRGVKSAGFNVGFLDSTFIFASNTVETIAFGEETLTSYEVGFKSTLADGRTRLNGAAFYYDYKDFQTFRFELLNQVIFNTDAEVKGAELELQTNPWGGLYLGLAMSYLDATAKDIPSPAGELRDRDMVAAPDFSTSAVVRYEWPMLDGQFAVQVSGNHEQNVYYDIQNVPVSRESGYTVGNLRASYARNNWEVAAWLDNFTNEEYLVYTFDFTGTFGFNQQAWGRPRWGGVSFRYNFQ
jgi:iron complex outermembrane recepter protein